MILLDAGYLIALFHSREQLHDRALAWIGALAERVIVTEYVLLETVNQLSAPADRPRVHGLIAQLQSDPECEIIPASRRLWAAGLELHRQRMDKEWSLTDCISFVVMEERRIMRALAYDHHFEQAGFEALLRRDPS